MMKPSVFGEYLIQVEERGVILREHRFKNLIVDGALALKSPFGWNRNALSIGAGVVTPPVYSDTALGNEIARNEFWRFYFKGIHTIGGKRYSVLEAYKEFTGIDASISEVGFWSDDIMVSRSLVKNTSGVPTQIVLQPHQTLRLFYYVHIEIPDEMARASLASPYGPLEFSLTGSNISGLDTNRPNFFAGEFSFLFRAWNTYFSFMDEEGARHSGDFFHEDGSQPNTTYTGVYIEPTNADRRFVSISNPNWDELPDLNLHTPFTLPAGHDFRLTLEIGWTRA